ncbi:hypothetical protein FVB43_20695 [Erwinia rhapontici]|uniref:hypothetical protein n=1 Tax=Erwinia rhapontici TaxID=55212 RepID=UPI0014382DF3|nr:hypothetical protein [Erwinia rhapontici]NKG32453.1 hypothetical protein [Erwinia rhapontici]
MKILQAQMAVFYKDQVNLDFDGLSYFFKKSIKEILNVTLENAQSFGFLPKDAPAEIPRLQLHSTDNKFRLQCSNLRCDFYYDHSTVDEKFDMNSFCSMIKSICDAHEKINKKINRIGLVAIGFIDAENPNKYIADRFLNSERIKKTEDLSDVSISYNRPLFNDNVQLNNITTYNTGKSIDGNEIILVKQVDINTSMEDDYSSHNNINVVIETFRDKVSIPE